MADLIIGENSNLVRQDIITNTDGYKVSQRYVPIATQQVLDEIKLHTEKIEITGFNNANVRSKAKQGFQRHAIMVELPNAELIDGTKMNMIIFNSNDRSSALKIHLGALRGACSNQMVFGTEIAEPVSIRHTQKDWKHSIKTLMDAYEESQSKTQSMIEDMINRSMSHKDMALFSEKAYEEILRPDITGSLLDPMQLNQIRRREDVGNNLWHSFNRIQEGLLQGGMDRIIDKEDEDGILFETVSKTHKVTDSAKQIDFNKRLHSLAINYFM